MYRVLARKYRPTTFADLIGQDVLVRTLSNAFSTGRIAHAFMLTGIRGIGKTTTARIIARGLNCIGEDGNGEPTTTPCGVCPNCKMIAEDRHVDVIEMDAASRTGVDDIREIIDSVPYAPVTGRYKIYIIDEVHMLSKNAFNALLKTLEEPPPYVKFIFATTEIRKIPVTIISRCQRFDLKRVETDTLAAHLQDIAKREDIALNDACAKLISVAAEGSVRDALSVLDRAISMHTDEQSNTDIQADSLRDMLGLADRSQSFKLLEHTLKGETDAALKCVSDMIENGAEPLQVLQDLIDITHFVSRVAIASELSQDLHYASNEQNMAKEMASGFSIPHLARAWQILLKGLDETRHSNHLNATLDMLIVRIAYASNLPTPAQLIRQIQEGEPALDSAEKNTSANNAPSSSGNHTNTSMQVTQTPAPEPQTVTPIVETASASATYQEPATAMHGNAALALAPQDHDHFETIDSFEVLVALFAKKREAILHAHLTNDLRLAQFEPGKLNLQPVSYLSPDIPVRIQRCLQDWTNERWQVSFVDSGGTQTLAEAAEREKKQALEYAANHPNVQKILSVFEDAEVVAFKPNAEENA